MVRAVWRCLEEVFGDLMVRGYHSGQNDYLLFFSLEAFLATGRNITGTGCFPWEVLFWNEVRITGPFFFFSWGTIFE